MDDFTNRGRWWLPGEEHATVPGTLAYSRTEGARLKVDQALLDSYEAIHEGLEIPVIHGEIEGHRPVSLQQSFCTRGGSESDPQEYFTHRILVGAHLGDHDSQLFTRVSFSLDLLRFWIPRQPIEYDKESRSFSVTLAGAEKCCYNTSLGRTIIYAKKQISQTAFQSFSVERNASISVEPSEQLVLGDIVSCCIRPMQNLITLAADTFCGIDSVNVQPVGLPDTPGSEVEVFFQPVEGDRSDPVYPHDMMFTHDESGSEWSERLDRWYRLSRELESVLNLYFTARFYRKQFVDTRFLALTQVLEAIHRVRYGDTVLPEEDHRRRVDAVLSAAPTEYQSWLKEQLRYSNSPTLRNRLKDLNARFGEVVTDLVGEGKKKESEFRNKVVDTRNFFVHRDPDLKKKAATKSDLSWLTDVLGYLIHAFLLSELGYETAELPKRLAKSPWYRHTKSSRS